MKNWKPVNFYIFLQQMVHPSILKFLGLIAIFPLTVLSQCKLSFLVAFARYKA